MAKTIRFTVRLSVEDWERIDARRSEYPGMSMSEYMRLAALDQLPMSLSVEDQFLAVEERLRRLESLSFSG